MDSRLRNLTIMAAVSVLILVALLVYYTNTKEEKAASALESETVADNSKEASDSQSSTKSGQIGTDLKAFLSDQTFFDSEENEELTKAKNKAKSLSMVMTSIEKDIRIEIVNGFGDLVTGKDFYVKLNQKDEYKDLDQDGIIYIGDLAPGEYQVLLEAVEDYNVPASPSTIEVKDQVEYIAISDISVLIKTEDEIDVEEDDKEEKDALEDTDNTAINTLQTVKGASLGIDVSKWNGDIDWEKVSSEGIEFAIIRAGYRGAKSGNLVEDPKFEENLEEAKKAGLKVGLYFFSQATNEVEAVEEASAVIELLDGEKLDLPVFIDSESSGKQGRADELDVDTRTLVCQAFCQTIQNAGYEGGVYASRNWFNKNLNVSKLEKNTIWLAEYRKIPLYEGYYNVWQYTSKGKLDGIDGNVDLDIWYN